MADSSSTNRRLNQCRKNRLVRLEILSNLYKRGYSYREMRAEVMARLDLRTYALSTLKNDIDTMLAEWREARIEDLDLALQLELERIDTLIKEAWEAWEKSKESYRKTKDSQEGVPVPTTKDDEDGDEISTEVKQGVFTIKVKRSSEDVVSCGDPRYLEVINKLCIERRKLLGLYSPEKHELNGEMNFYNLLMETGKEEEGS